MSSILQTTAQFPLSYPGECSVSLGMISGNPNSLKLLCTEKQNNSHNFGKGKGKTADLMVCKGLLKDWVFA